MRKGLFIGLGGSGTETVAHIKAKLLKHLGNHVDLNADSSFLCFDTDKDTINKINRTSGLKDILSKNDFFDLGDTNPYQVYRSVAGIGNPEEKETFNDWAYKPENWPNRALSEGAKAERQYGRSAIFNEYAPISTRISSKIQSLNIMQNDDILNMLDGKDDEAKKHEIDNIAPMIWVFSSSCGGTGSSLLMDVLYLIDRIYHNQFSALGEAFVQLFFYTPRPFIKKNMANIRYLLNPIAIFNEINQVYSDYLDGNNSFDAIKARPLNNMYRSDDKYSPFRYIIPIDSQMGVQDIPLQNLYEMTAQLCTYMHLGSAGGKALSNLDNDVQNVQKNPNYLRKDNRDVIWLPFLVAAGFRTLVKPDLQLQEYIKSRLAFEIVEFGLLGESFDKTESIEKQKEIVESFALNTIFRFINSKDRHSSGSNLEIEYKKIFFNGIGGDKDDFSLARSVDAKNQGDKNSLNADFNALLIDIQNSLKQLKIEFDKTENESVICKSAFLLKIVDEVGKFAEESILRFGLKYTEELIRRVDDNRCTEILEQISLNRTKQFNANKEQEKTDAITRVIAKASKKEWNNYLLACQEYAIFMFEKFINECKVELLNDLTIYRTGVLEKFRNLNSDGIGGIGGYILAANSLSKNYRQKYCELAKIFRQSHQDLATEYIPSLAGLTQSDKVWEAKNEFSKLYHEAIVGKKTNLGINDVGDSVSIRNSTNSDGINDPTIERVFRKLHAKFLLGDSSLYLCAPENLYGKNNQLSVLQAMLDKVNESLIEEIDQNQIVEGWTNKTLSSYFNGSNLSDDQRAAYILKMNNRNNILYNTKGSKPAFSEKIIFAGADVDLAKKFGHVPGSNDSEYIPANELQNTLYMIRLISGYTLEHYDQFEVLNSTFYAEKSKGFLEYFPYLHKGLLTSSKLSEVSKFQTLKTPETIIRLFYYNAIIQSLFKEKRDLYDSIFKVTSTDVDDILNMGLDFTSSDDKSMSLIELNLKQNNASLTIAGSIKTEKGFIQMGDYSSSNIPCNGANELFSRIQTYVKDYERRYFEMNTILGRLNDLNKRKLSDFVSEFHSIIIKQLGNNLVVKLNQNSFINDQTDRDFMKKILNPDQLRDTLLSILNSQV